MKINKLYIVILLGILFSCTEDFLIINPPGALSGEQLENKEGAEDQLIAAYAALANGGSGHTISSLWPYSSVHSDDAHKGGGGVGNRIEYDRLEQYYTIESDPGYDAVFGRLYTGVSRANSALRTIKAIDEADFPLKQNRMAEARFLRGHFFFTLKILFKYIPYFDETVRNDEILSISNRDLTNDELWDKIAEDFQFAADNLPLPANQPDQGRTNQMAAKAYLAKVRLYQAYEQDENHNVVGINTQRLEQVVTLTDEVIASNYDLNTDYAENFLCGFENSQESVFEVQYSINDGTDQGRLNMEHSLNYSMAPQYGCCWFHIPTQNLVNAFKTDANGVPMFDTFNNEEMKDPADFLSNGVDPRLDHTVGIHGHPFKYQPDVLYDNSWERVPQVYGSFGNMKEQQPAGSSCLRKVGAYFGSSMNVSIIRFADVLLWKAEALIELGRQNEALPLINKVRERASNSTGRLSYSDGTFASNYRISLYEDGVNIDWTKENARKALQWERRLEFAMENSRFFDLVRWGIAAETLNDYLDTERDRREFLSNAQFTKNKHEYLPISNNQINYTNGVLIQNPNY
ncbi:MAG: RagB/SusD family nutrient uptake outer membrane protein [Cyclobacteriaceae bacterium]